jgi:hypothetical protein
MSEFLQSDVAKLIGLAIILGGGLFVVLRVIAGRPSMGGGVTGSPRPKPDPYGNMTPKGSGTGTTQPPKNEV